MHCLKSWASAQFFFEGAFINYMKFILGEKISMSQIFDEKGNAIPVTLISAGPCEITQIKTDKIDGYNAVQMGFKKIEKKSKIKKSQGLKTFQYLREIKNEEKELKLGQEIDVSVFKEGDKVSVSGISKGKGFQGAVKRWGFAGQPATRGTKREHRTLGSTGSRYPQRVIKGKKMPGRMGGERVTVKNLKVIKIDKENNLLAVEGAVPGRRGTLLEIKQL